MYKETLRNIDLYPLTQLRKEGDQRIYACEFFNLNASFLNQMLVFVKGKINLLTSNILIDNRV